MKRQDMTVAIVGAGPAGLRAAAELVRAGLRPVLIDEAARPGGQIYRQPPAALRRPPGELYGVQAARAQALFDTWDEIRAQVDYRPETLVWQIEERCLHLARGDRHEALPVDALILATGATDRVLPFAGWTLPGVFTLGGAQALLKAQGVAIGPRVVLAGTGPLLYLVATQLHAAGSQVQAVIDVAAPGARRRALPGLLSRPLMALNGATLLARLRMAGIAVHRDARLLRAVGEGRVSQLHWSVGGQAQTTDCDALAFGHGLRSETQLADLAGCRMAWDEVEQAWLPEADGDGRSSQSWVYLAGDGAAIRGADAAEAAGRRASLALLADRDGVRPAGRRAPVHEPWRRAMAVLCEPAADWALTAPDELVVCRCEHVSAGELRRCAQDSGADEINRLKALSRVGMGRCQGRMCAAAATRILAQAQGIGLDAVGRLRAQPPVKPVAVGVLALGAQAGMPRADNGLEDGDE